MAAIVDLSDLINLGTGGGAGPPERINFFKDGRVGAAVATTPVAGRMTSLWEYNGSPSHGAVPSASWANTDNTTTGGLKQTDAGGGRVKRLLAFFAMANQLGTLILYDRLGHIASLDATNTGAQTISSSITRYTNGADAEGRNEVWVEIYTIIGTTGTTITMSYTDDAGNTGQTSPATAIGGTGLREAQRIIPLPLAAGDSGVRAVASVTLAATTGTAGNFGIVIARPLMQLSMLSTGVAMGRDTLRGLPPMPEIKVDACLALAWLPNAALVPNIPHGFVTFVEK